MQQYPQLTHGFIFIPSIIMLALYAFQLKCQKIKKPFRAFCDSATENAQAVILGLGCSISQHLSQTVNVILPTAKPHLRHLFLIHAHSTSSSLQLGQGSSLTLSIASCSNSIVSIFKPIFLGVVHPCEYMVEYRMSKKRLIDIIIDIIAIVVEVRIPLIAGIVNN